MRRLVWIGAAAGLVVIVAAGLALIPGLLDEWRRKLFPSTASGDYTWLSATLEACEKEAAADRSTVYFMVVPLSPTRRYGEEWNTRAIGTAGAVALFGSGETFEGLDRGVFRISSEPYIFIATDEKSDEVRRWSSATGVLKLTWPNMQSDGPFRVRFQTSPSETDDSWSTVTADGRGTCHWVYALLKR